MLGLVQGKFASSHEPAERSPSRWAWHGAHGAGLYQRRPALWRQQTRDTALHRGTAYFIASLAHFLPDLSRAAATLGDPLLNVAPMGIQGCWPSRATGSLWERPVRDEFAHGALVEASSRAIPFIVAPWTCSAITFSYSASRAARRSSLRRCHG
jgi:hypothetical protein